MMIEAKNVSGGYGPKIVCHDISFTLSKGEMLCVAGPNGSGKSTLFRLLLGFNPLSGGEVSFDGKSLQQLSAKQLADHIAYIPQNHNPIFSYSVLEVVLMGRVNHFAYFSTPKPVDEDIAQNCLSMLKISHLAEQDYTTLSGGQRQLVLIARALAQEAQILMMDEPAASLDYANGQLILEAVADLRQSGYAVIMSTHSMDTPFACADKVLLLKQGYVHSYGTPLATLTAENLQQVYGIEMDVMQVKDRNNHLRYFCLPVQKPL